MMYVLAGIALLVIAALVAMRIIKRRQGGDFGSALSGLGGTSWCCFCC